MLTEAMQKLFYFVWRKSTFILGRLPLKPDNKRTFNGIVDETFEEIDSFSE